MENITTLLSQFDCVTIEDKMRFELDGVIEKVLAPAYGRELFLQCAACIDYTTLRLTDTDTSVGNFVADLLKRLTKNHLPEVAAVCVFPRFISGVRHALEGTGIRACAVGAAFPFAQTFPEVKEQECRQAVAAGAQEVDVVLSVGDLLERRYEAVYRELAALRVACAGAGMKVILETGELKEVESVFHATLIAAYAGADFVKTSTGKVPVNATPESVYVMCEALRQYRAVTGKTAGIKVAGGISRMQNAIRYATIVRHLLGKEQITPALFRIGASQLLDDLIKELPRLSSEPVG